MVFLNSITNRIICLLHITHLYLGFININSTKNLCIYFSGLKLICFFGDELLEFLLHSITIEDTLKLDPGHTVLEGLEGILKGGFMLIPDSLLGVWQKNFLLLVITGKSYDFYDPKSLIHTCIPMTSEKWIGLIVMGYLAPKNISWLFQ